MSYLDRIAYHAKRVGQPHYKVLAGAIEQVAPDAQAVLDIGCSAGALLGELSAPCRMGIDKSRAAEDLFESLWPECVFEQYDLEVDDWWLGHFDLIVCLEVAEHVRNHRNLLWRLDEWAAAHCALVWSAAPLGQRGRGHVTLRPYRWWRRQLVDRGWTWDVEATDEFVAAVTGKVPGHYERNMRIYRK